MIAALIEVLASGRLPGQARELAFTPMGGAYNRVPSDATAFVHRSEEFLLERTVTSDPAEVPATRQAASQWLSAGRQLRNGYGSGRAYQNFPDPELLEPLTSYYGENLARLRDIKARYDADNFFHHRQSILMVFPGIGTAVNVVAVLIGSSIGLLLGARLPTRTRDTVTDALGLVTLLIGALSAAEVTSSALSAAVGSSAPVLIVLGAVLVGGIAGSLLDIEARLEGFGGWLRTRFARRRSAVRRDVPQQARARKASGDVSAGTSPSTGAAPDVPTGTSAEELTSPDQVARERFIEGFVTASLIFCVGPLTILGSLSDGLGRGPDQLILKAVLDGFAAIAFAASLGPGVMASVAAIVVVQGSLTLVGVFIGDVLAEAYIAAITATGGLLLIGVGLRLLQIKAIPVGNLLPALLVAPLLVSLVAALR